MKKTYIKPVIEAVLLIEQSQLLADSLEIKAGRYAGGDPTNPSEGPGISGEIDNSSSENNGYGYGQGDPYNPIGGGNRSKANTIWDDWE